MSYFYLYNPKFYDPGSSLRIPRDSWEKKRVETKELEEKKEEFRKISDQNEPIRKQIAQIKEDYEKRAKLIEQQRRLLEAEAEIAKLIIEMEEEEMLAIFLLLND